MTSRVASLGLGLSIFFACDSTASTKNEHELPRIEKERPTAAALCEHTRKVLGEGHGRAMSDAEWLNVKEGCVADFEAKRDKWGDQLYETFLSCALRAQDMRTMVECDQVAARRAGLPLADASAPDEQDGPQPGGKLLYEALVRSEGPAKVGPVAAINWDATFDDITTKLPEVQRRIYRPSAHLLEAELREDLSGTAHLVAWRAWLPAQTKPDELVNAWGSARMAEDEEGTHYYWCEPKPPDAWVPCATFTQPKAGAQGPSALPYVRLSLGTRLDAWYGDAERQRPLADLLASENVEQALSRGGRFVSRDEAGYLFEQVRDAGDLRAAGWRWVIEGDRLVALEVAPSGDRDPTLPERMRKLAKSGWEHGLQAEWTPQRKLRLTRSVE